MPILSYLVFPAIGRKEELREALKAFSECDVIPSENEDVLVLVAETGSKREETALQDRLMAIPSLDGISLVAGFEDPEAQTDD